MQTDAQPHAAGEQVAANQQRAGPDRDRDDALQADCLVFQVREAKHHRGNEQRPPGAEPLLGETEHAGAEQELLEHSGGQCDGQAGDQHMPVMHAVDAVVARQHQHHHAQGVKPEAQQQAKAQLPGRRWQGQFRDLPAFAVMDHEAIHAEHRDTGEGCRPQPLPSPLREILPVEIACQVQVEQDDVQQAEADGREVQDAPQDAGPRCGGWVHG
jgi:hypothetical protein